MSDYIDREKFIKLLVNRDLREISTKTIGECLDKAEVADVVEVVRCKDCIYHSENGWCGADHLGGRWTEGDDFCSFGEEREHETTE